MFISILPPSLILLVGRSQRYNLNHITLKRWILIFYVLDFLEWLVFANSVMCSYFQGRLIANDAFHAHFIIDWLWTIIVVSMIKHFAVLNQLKRNQWNENYFVRCVLILRGEVKMCFFSFYYFQSPSDRESNILFFSLLCCKKCEYKATKNFAEQVAATKYEFYTFIEWFNSSRCDLLSAADENE